MRKVYVLLFTGVLFTCLGCSGNPQKSTPAMASASLTRATASSLAADTGRPVPPSIVEADQHAWHSETIQDQFGSAVALKVSSTDGKYDFIVVERGTSSFFSFARHGRWEYVCNRPGKGTLIELRVKFEHEREKRIKWDELGFATENVCGVLWSYPARTEATISRTSKDSTSDSVGGDQLLVQEMIKGKRMSLEVEPGVTTQFETAGFAKEINKIRTPTANPSSQTAQ